MIRPSKKFGAPEGSDRCDAALARTATACRKGSLKVAKRHRLRPLPNGDCVTPRDSGRSRFRSKLTILPGTGCRFRPRRIRGGPAGSVPPRIRAAAASVIDGGSLAGDTRGRVTTECHEPRIDLSDLANAGHCREEGRPRRTVCRFAARRRHVFHSRVGRTRPGRSR